MGSKGDHGRQPIPNDMDILGGMSKKSDNKGGRFKETKKANYSDYFKTRKY